MLIENGGEERNGKAAAHARRLEKLHRNFGPSFLAALNRPQTIEILLNADGTLWHAHHWRLPQHGDNLGSAYLGRGAAPGRSRFAGQLPLVVSAPTFVVRKRASSVFTLDQHVEQGIMTPEQKELLCAGIREQQNILVIGGTASGKDDPD